MSQNYYFNMRESLEINQVRLMTEIREIRAVYLILLIISTIIIRMNDIAIGITTS
jgi:hypothetical protein